jgi:hypothetical protein
MARHSVTIVVSLVIEMHPLECDYSMPKTAMGHSLQGDPAAGPAMSAAVLKADVNSEH